VPGLFHGTSDEAAHGVFLPARLGHDLLQGRAPGPLSNSRTRAVFVPAREPEARLARLLPLARLLVCFARRVSFFDLAFRGARSAPCAPARRFLVGLGPSGEAAGCALAVSSEIPFILRSPFAVETAITT
jgi:hypothetical protein